MSFVCVHRLFGKRLESLRILPHKLSYDYLTGRWTMQYHQLDKKIGEIDMRDIVIWSEEPVGPPEQRSVITKCKPECDIGEPGCKHFRAISSRGTFIDLDE